MTEARKVVPKVKGLNCPGCGNALEIRSLGRAISVTCAACLRVLDVRDSNVKILVEFLGRQRILPEIPLGKRGKLGGVEYEVIGFQERSVGGEFNWYEYLLFNPYKGYKYLVTADGHWNEVTPVHSVPRSIGGTTKPVIEFSGERFAHFSAANARTSYVFGEFPWEIRKGEQARCDDFIAPPRMLSSENYGGEITWSLAEYRPSKQIGETFGVSLREPWSANPFANQPNPYDGKPTKAWMWFGLMFALLMALATWMSLATSSKEVFNRNFTVDSRGEEEKASVTETFEIPGSGMLHIELNSFDVVNSEAFVGVTLINESTGRAWEFGRSLSHYSGVEDGESWAEAKRTASVNLPGIPAGTYYFRIGSGLEGQPGALPQTATYSIKASRTSSVSWPLFCLVLFLLTIPPIWYSMQKANFETRRWNESDYAPEDTSSGDDE